MDEFSGQLSHQSEKVESKHDDMMDFMSEMKQPVLFDNACYYRLRSHLVELVEEVKLKRVTECENEEKIRLLVHEKHELERKQESEQDGLFNLTDNHEHKLMEQKRHYEDQVHTLQEQVKKLQVHRECNEAESKILKDEIRSLQWTKYSLDKKLREQEHMLLANHMSSDQHLQEMSALEKKMAAMMSHYQHLADGQKCLENNVTEAVKLNKKLMYVNEHQSCLQEEMKVENLKLKQQLIGCNVKLSQQPIKSIVTVELQDRINALQRTLKIEEEKRRKFQEKANENNTKYEDVLRLLQESHELTDKHLANANKHQKEARQLKNKCEENGKCLMALRLEFEQTQQQLQEQKLNFDENLLNWTKKEEDLDCEVNGLKESLVNKERQMLNLEEINSQWAERNVDLSAELKEARIRLNVPKVNKEIQSGANFFSFLSQSTQTSKSEQNSSTQTNRRATRTTCTQCFVAALCNNSSQTSSVESPSKETIATQTCSDIDPELPSKNTTATQTCSDVDMQVNHEVSENRGEKRPDSQTCNLSQLHRRINPDEMQEKSSQTEFWDTSSSTTCELKTLQAGTQCDLLPIAKEASLQSKLSRLLNRRPSFKQSPPEFQNIVDRQFKTFERDSDSFQTEKRNCLTSFGNDSDELASNASKCKIPNPDLPPENLETPDGIVKKRLFSQSDHKPPPPDSTVDMQRETQIGDQPIIDCQPKEMLLAASLPKYPRLTSINRGIGSSPVATGSRPLTETNSARSIDSTSTNPDPFSGVKTIRPIPYMGGASISRFPSMGVKVVCSKNLYGKQELQSALWRSSISSVHDVDSQSEVPSGNKGILRGLCLFKGSQPKSVKFADETIEK